MATLQANHTLGACEAKAHSSELLRNGGGERGDHHFQTWSACRQFGARETGNPVGRSALPLLRVFGSSPLVYPFRVSRNH